MRRRSYALVVLAVFVLAAAARAVPLFWSPLPATLDGFDYARLAVETAAAGALPLAAMAADELVFTLDLTALALVTGVDPLSLAQPFAALAGGAAPLAGVALVRAVAGDDADPRWVRGAALLCGVVLAVEGVFLRRSGVPDEEALGLLLVPLLAIACDRFLRTRSRAWLAVSLPLLAAFPLLHNFSSFHAVLTVTAVVALRARSPWAVGAGGALAVGFWAWFFGYYSLAAYLPVSLTYSGLIRGRLGLLTAWVVLLVAGVLRIRAASGLRQRVLYGTPLALWFAVLAANAVRPVFPGTVATEPRLLAFAGGLFVIAALGVVGVPSAVRGGAGPVVLALVAGPATVVFYVLTGGLTPQFWDAVLRAQTFAHVGAVVVACTGVVAVSRRRPRAAALLAAVLLAGALLTVPLGYVNLDTGTYPSTTFESERAAVVFVNQHMTVSATTADTLTRVDNLYYPAPPTLVEGPTRAWLSGGLPPDCPVLVQASWRTTGAHLYPQPPGVLKGYDAWSAGQHRIYATTGYDPVGLYVPAGTGVRGCRSA